MTQLTKRRLSIVLAVVAVIGAIAFRNYLAGQKTTPPRKPQENTLKQVVVMTAQNETLATTLDIQGRLAAFDKVEIFAEVGGMAKSATRAFKVGTAYSKGQPMLVMDDTEPRLALLAQKSTLLNAIAQAMPDLKIDYPESYPTWEAYLNGFDVEKAIAPLPIAKNDREKRFVAARNLLTQYYTIKSQEERLSKYTLYAPFSGVLTEAAVNPGSIIRVGQKLGTLMATGNYELVATVPLSDLDAIQLGGTVTLKSEDVAGQWTGTVKRISDQIDVGSQTVQVFVAVNGGNLREGMYLYGNVTARSVADAMRVPRELLVNQRGVYEVQDSILRLRDVELIKTEGQNAIIRGIPNGTRILGKMVPGAYDGMKVKPLS